MKRVYIISINTYPEKDKDEIENIINRECDLEVDLFETNEVGIFIDKST